MIPVDQFMKKEMYFGEVRYDDKKSPKNRSETSRNISDDEAESVYGLNEWGEGISDLR